jgi:hypothetical protein
LVSGVLPQTPSEQVGVLQTSAVQTWLHTLQLFGSVFTFTQVPLQQVNPTAQLWPWPQPQRWLVQVSPVGQFGGLVGSLVEQQLPGKHCPPQQTLPAPQLVAVQMHVPLPLQTGVLPLHLETHCPLSLHVRHFVAPQVPQEPPHVSEPQTLPPHCRVQQVLVFGLQTQFVMSGQGFVVEQAAVPQLVVVQVPLMQS